MLNGIIWWLRLYACLCWSNTSIDKTHSLLIDLRPAWLVCACHTQISNCIYSKSMTTCQARPSQPTHGAIESRMKLAREEFPCSGFVFVTQLASTWEYSRHKYSCKPATTYKQYGFCRVSISLLRLSTSHSNASPATPWPTAHTTNRSSSQSQDPVSTGQDEAPGSTEEWASFLLYVPVGTGLC